MASGKISLPPEFRQLAHMGMALIRQTSTARKDILGQLTEALQTGGVKSKIPLIQRGVEASNAAMSQGLRSNADELAKRNISGPFAASMLAGQRMAGEMATSQIPTGTAEKLIGQFMPFLASTQGLGFGALSQAGQATLSTDSFNAQQTAKFNEDLKSSLQSVGSGAAQCLHPGTQIATPFGWKAIEVLERGDKVFSQNTDGTECIATVVDKQSRQVPESHAMIQILTGNAHILVSPRHPLPNGEPALKHTNAVLVAPSAIRRTVDIRVDGPTGNYCAAGVWLGSTLDPRHQREIAGLNAPAPIEDAPHVG